MKIKIVRFPYQDYDVGDIIDLGEEKNASLVSLQRAVYVDETPKKKKKTSTKETTEKEETTKETTSETPTSSTEDEEKSEDGKKEEKKGLWSKMS